MDILFLCLSTKSLDVLTEDVPVEYSNKKPLWSGVVKKLKLRRPLYFSSFVIFVFLN